MSVRIYALAKELKLETNELVDICNKAGIQGKNSALSSLTDEEVEKVRQFRAGGTTPSPAAETSSEPPVQAEPTSPATAARKTATAEVQTPVRREDYIAPSGSTGKLPVLDVKGRKAAAKPKPAPEEDSPPKPPQRATPTVKLAPMPTVEQPQPEVPTGNEPAPQKPDMKLPVDALRASKGGGRPLADHLKKHEEQSRETGSGRRGKSPPAETPPQTSAAPLRGRTRKGKGGEAAGTQEERPRKQLLGREARQLNRRRSGNRSFSLGEDTERRPRRSRTVRRRSGVSTAAPRKGKVAVTLPCTVRSFCEATGVAARDVLGVLLSEGTMANVNTQLDDDIAEFVAAELGIEAEFRAQVSLEDKLLSGLWDQEDSDNELLTRPPVITFLGHVDHGKTSLLDRILGIDVVSGESGGITQHIRAYQIQKDDSRIAFVDTPGHEAFTEMRARGANVTDIAVVVVAADDGVMPQTEEAISHARAAEVPIVVALNKIDLPGVDENRAMQGLSSNDLLPSEWGGDVEVIKTSAITGDGIDDLLDTLLTVAELHNYQANPDRPAIGTCLEAHQETGRGVVAKLIVQNGTLRVGDVIVSGSAHGRVKAMYDTLQSDQTLEEAGPSTPINVTGLDEAPEAGERFYVLEDISQAREIAEQRSQDSKTASLSGTGQPHVTLENLFERLEGAGDVPTLNIILRADVRGSIEAIEKEFGKLRHDEVKIRVLQKSVGGITEADVHLADASDAIIIGFNVVPDEGARHLADDKGIQVRRYEIIYKVTEDIKAALEGMLEPEKREVEMGRTLVQQTFSISRVGTIAGCRVIAGKVERDARARLIRNNTVIGDYPIGSLRREKNDVKEVREGMECGIKLEGFNDLKEADILEIYRVEQIGRVLDV